MIAGLFYVLFGLELFAPRFPGELIFDLICLLVFSGVAFQRVRMRCVTTSILVSKYIIFAVSLVYGGLIIYQFTVESLNLFDEPSHTWRSLMHAWYFITFGVFALSSSRFIRFFSNLQNEPARFIASIYTGTALIASLLLVLPISLSEGVELSHLDAFFTTVSAISGTGLVVVNTANTFSLLGEIIILIVMQAGGIGVITFSGILLLVIGKELGLREKLIQDDTEKMFFFGNLKSFTLTVALIMLIFESIGAVLLYPFMSTQVDSGALAAFHAVFHSVSAFCTAGFTTLPNGMMAASGAPFPLIVVAVLAVFGMLGLPTIINLVQFIRPPSPFFRLRAYSKMELLMAASVLVISTLAIFILEYDNLIYSSAGDRLLHSFFQSSMRNAGFNSITVSQMGIPAIFILMGAMIIGGAPMSTAGGIKTASIGAILTFVFCFLTGKSEARFAGRSLSPLLLLKAVSLVVAFFILWLVGFIFLYLVESSATGIEVLFETLSALTVTGLSLGITSDLSTPGRVIIIALMMIGRIGLLTAVYALIINRKPSRYSYPQGEFYVG